MYSYSSSNIIGVIKSRIKRWRSWLRNCATSRKVAGSIPDGVTGFFHWHNPSGRTMALGVDSASNRNEYQEYFLGAKGGRCVGLTTLPASSAGCLEILEPQPPGTLRACPGLLGDCFLRSTRQRAKWGIMLNPNFYVLDDGKYEYCHLMWYMAPCILVGIYQRFGGMLWLRLG